MQETVKSGGMAEGKPEGHDEIEASKAPLMDHLIELRQRMIYALIGVGIGFAICFAFATDIYNLLVQPYVWARGADASPREVARLLSKVGGMFNAIPFSTAHPVQAVRAGRLLVRFYRSW